MFKIALSYIGNFVFINLINIINMKTIILRLAVATLLISCGTPVTKDESKKAALPIQGTWKLITGITIDKGDSTITDYTTGQQFIKIINEDHFAFINHDLNKGGDSAAIFSSGAGTYTLTDSLYTEHLEYCTDRQWEGNDFTFTIRINNDTLIQKGIEKIENIGVDRINIEKYIRLKK